MRTVARFAGDLFVLQERPGDCDLGFLPKTLATQCQSLIESFHDVHGFACLPDILWRSQLGPFIEQNGELRLALKKASTTRSAKKSQEGFVRIATTILSLEILASSFAGWSAIYPEEAARARDALRQNPRGRHLPLMEFYLYPPKHISPAAIATLAPPMNRSPRETDLCRGTRPELSGAKKALDYASQQALNGAMPQKTRVTTN